MKKQTLSIPPIELEWSDWHPWAEIKQDARRGGVNVSQEKGVYEVRRVGEKKRLAIGKASNLRMRVKQGLVKGKVPHSAGEMIRAGEDTYALEIRWAETKSLSVAEEELHRRHKKRYGSMPEYTERT